MKKTVVVGFGNPILSDDGVGLAVARRVKCMASGSDCVDVIELNAGGIRLVEAISGYGRALLVDAMVTGTTAPGTVSFVDPANIGSARNISCVHDMDLPTAIEMGRALGMDLPEDISVLGIEAACVNEFSEKLTYAVSAAVPLAVEKVMNELRKHRGLQ